jgi:hypothetical protein
MFALGVLYISLDMFALGVYIYSTPRANISRDIYIVLLEQTYLEIYI